MEQYIGLDVSMKETAISIRQGGKRIWRGKCASDPQLLAAVIRKRAPYARRIVFETGPLMGQSSLARPRRACQAQSKSIGYTNVQWHFVL
ncbi:hypothetical protein X770_29865 [Mesorhizobium sp. LSJC269B00]|nr:hypothetical protein X770_29865 [Mesorhizobium sp. LSJC269B00]ESZ10148.1 hypothetical protein X736_02540 [Mesorhizobium sp. L2C089B000]